MRRARLNVKPNISVKGDRGVVPSAKSEHTSNEPVAGSRQGKEQLVVPAEHQPTQDNAADDAAQNVVAKTQKNSPQKDRTSALTAGVTSVKVVQRRSRIKPPVLVTRNRTSTAEVKHSPGHRHVPREEAAIASPPVTNTDHKVAAQHEELNGLDEPDVACQSRETEERLNEAVKKVVKVSPGHVEEAKPLSSPNAGKTFGVLRRSHFPKTRPNLVYTGRHGRTRHSSQSETGDETGKMQGPPSIQRVASLSPAAARLVPMTPDTGCSEVFVPPVCVSVSLSKQCSNTSVVEDVVETEPPEETLDKTLMSKTEKKQVMRRKRRKMEMLAGEVDRSKLTMRDLIYMNPVDNPMRSTIEEAERRRKSRTDEQTRKQEEDAQREEKRDEVEAAESDENDDVITLEDEAKSVVGSERCDGTEDREDGEEETLVPQLIVGPDGNIVINQASLTIETNKTKGKEQEDWDIVTEEFSSTSLAYGRKPPSRLWKLSETKKFYVALSTVGTDFSLMCNLFPKRSRVELKRKFKREEKQNKHLVDTALMERRGFDVTLFEDLTSEEDEETEKKKKRKKSTKRKGKNEKENQEMQKRKMEGDEGQTCKKRRKKKTRSKYYDDSSSESETEETVCDDVTSPNHKRTASDVDEDRCSTIPGVESPHPSDKEESDILKTMCRTTRYGRKPRPIKTYEAPTAATHRRRSNSKPAVDIASVASTSQFSSPPHGGLPTRSVIMSPGREMFARSPSGQLISLANIGQSSPVADMANSQFVFVTSPPRQNADGTVSTSPQVIHVYLVSNTNTTPPGGVKHVLPSSDTQVLPGRTKTSPSSHDGGHVTDAVKT